MERLWAWFANRMKDPPASPKLKVTLSGLSAWGRYTLWPTPTVTVKPWATRQVVIHEYSHHYQQQRADRPTVQGFPAAVGEPSWTRRAAEAFAESLTRILLAKPRTKADRWLLPLLKRGV